MFLNNLSFLVNEKNIVFEPINAFLEIMSSVKLTILICLLSHVAYSQVFRSFDGTDNNEIYTEWGSAGQEFSRVTTIGYTDGVSTPAGLNRINARELSNELFSVSQVRNSELSLSDNVWAFGQFVAHDLHFTDQSVTETAYITMPDDEATFDVASIIPMFRAEGTEGSGTSTNNPRNYNNNVSAYLDASNVYGSTLERANWLRTFNNGKLKVSSGDLLPWNTMNGEFNQPMDLHAPKMNSILGVANVKMFVAGDVRANENPQLLAIHILFLREHNRVCDVLAQENQSWTDEQLYQEARRQVIATYQSIIFNEWLPTQGVHLNNYAGYDANEEVSIHNVFAHSAFKLYYTLTNSKVVRMDSEGNEIDRGNTSMSEAFFNPVSLLLAGGIDPYFIGMATQVQQELDCQVVDDLRNVTLGDDESLAVYDFVAININRGRDVGLPDYNTIRSDFGLPRANSFQAIASNNDNANKLAEVYETVNDVDPWVGMLAEKHMPDAMFGQLIMTIFEDQFELLRNGDRFYFENDAAGFDDDALEIFRAETLQKLIMRNTDIEILQEDVFRAMPYEDIPTGPDLTGDQNLEAVLYPNPISNKVNIKFFLENESRVFIRVYDLNGKMVFNDMSMMPKGENYVRYDFGNILANGMYNIYIEAGYDYKIMKLFKY